MLFPLAFSFPMAVAINKYHDLLTDTRVRVRVYTCANTCINDFATYEHNNMH